MDEGLLPEIAPYDPYFLPLNASIASKGYNSNFYILSVTEAGVVPCVDPKKSPRTSSDYIFLSVL